MAKKRLSDMTAEELRIHNNNKIFVKAMAEEKKKIAQILADAGVSSYDKVDTTRKEFVNLVGYNGWRYTELNVELHYHGRMIDQFGYHKHYEVDINNNSLPTSCFSITSGLSEGEFTYSHGDEILEALNKAGYKTFTVEMAYPCYRQLVDGTIFNTYYYVEVPALGELADQLR